MKRTPWIVCAVLGAALAAQVALGLHLRGGAQRPRFVALPH